MGWRSPAALKRSVNAYEGLSQLGVLVLADLQVHPASGPVDDHEQILAGCLVLHLGQVLDVDVHKARLVGLEPLGGLGSCLVAIPLPLQGPEVGHTVTAEAAIQRRTAETGLDEFPRCPPWRAKRRRVVPGSREATRDTRRAEGAKGDPKGASERGVQSYGRPVCSRNELAMLWRNAG